jgi:GNAT superfamily N-acetyltransferase
MPLEKLALTIRPATPSDYEQWLPLWQGYNAFYGRSGPTALPEAITLATWSRFHDPNEPMHCIVGEHEGKLTGIVHYLFHRTTISLTPTCYLQDLFTDEAHRGQGIARKLIQAVYAQATQAGSARVYWLTHETNSTAMQLYEQVADKSGFVVYRKAME